ncbi:hypothetical protein [Phenylobacterium sp.]|uniref:hypothetical protein n=1 Tax=Phenylobacterium sp. TaxID=1871053 RepID=UPI0035AE5D7D
MLRVPDAELPQLHPDRARLAAITARLGVPAGALRLLGSMSDYVAYGQATRPQVRDAKRQQALTDRFLAPVLGGLEALFLHVRAELDPALRAAQPFRGEAAYPLGQCLEITVAVQRRLAGLDPAALPAAAATALAALRAFTMAGGEVRRAWGDLRGRYFQNALLVGVLYVDVANDTVVVTKPKVEILPLAAADFRPIADYGHYARIAGAYWRRRSLPNHVVPGLAPYLPLIEVAANGGLRLGPVDPYMLSLTVGGGFAPSARALEAAPLPDEVFSGLRAMLRDGPFDVAADPATGRLAALAACGQADPDCGDAFNRALALVGEANRRLARGRLVERQVGAPAEVG